MLLRAAGGLAVEVVADSVVLVLAVAVALAVALWRLMCRI